MGYLTVDLGFNAHPEAREFFFSACLTAAQSVYYVLDQEAGRATFRPLQKAWRQATGSSGATR